MGRRGWMDLNDVHELQGQLGTEGEGEKGPRMSSSFKLHNCVDGVGVD